ncbi:MAG TPA: aminotransferase class III-fold pyridoxal phosphate-dependent enzyme [Jatrophihabitans sp.]|nr:aminotransferase class III-fold pyridoxal phosphate-dependent enzyme [Jatrophihabitans sp.]
MPSSADGAPAAERHRAAEAELLAEPAGTEAAAGGRVWVRGRGAVLTDLDGASCLDLGAGTLTQPLGHCHPAVVAAVREQAGELENVHDNPTPARLRAARALRRLLPAALERVSFFSSGTEVVEASLRVVHAAAEPHRKRIVALRRGFHGKSRGARALVGWDVGSEPAAAASLGYNGYCYRCPFQLSYPSCDLLCARLTVSQCLAKPDVAALVAEPVQGAAGVIVPPPGYWEILGEACQRYGVLLVADEVLTGGGRTGPFLASELFGLRPDLVTLAKGIGSGYPVSALAGPARLLDAPTFGRAGGSSSSFGGNAIGLAAAAATLHTLAADAVLDRVPELAGTLAEGLAPLAGLSQVGEVRQAGLLAGIEFVRDPASRAADPELAAAVARRAAALGVRVLPGGTVLRVAPPLVIEPAELTAGLALLVRATREVLSGAAA